MCVKAHELIAEKTHYPLHVGITEAGTVTCRQYQVCGRSGTDFESGNRRYDPRVPDRQSAGGDQVGKADFEDAGTAQRWHRGCFTVRPADSTQIDLIGLANQVETHGDRDFPNWISRLQSWAAWSTDRARRREADALAWPAESARDLIEHGEVLRKVAGEWTCPGPSSEAITELAQEKNETA